jgi:hypothetical protein
MYTLYAIIAWGTKQFGGGNVPVRAMTVLLNGRVAVEKDQNLTDDEMERSLCNLYHDANDLEFLYDLHMLETKTSKIFRLEEMKLPLVETCTALEATCGDFQSLVKFVQN